jgi:uncharacterized protein YbaP (TraB family)
MLRLALAAVLVLAAVGASAQDDDRNPPLFLVEDGDSKGYLLGSVHMLPEGALPMPAAVEAAYDEAEVLAFELDLDVAMASAQTMLMAGMDEETVAAALSEEQKAAFDAYATPLGLPGGALDRFEPWLASLTLATLTIQNAGITGEGVDAYFFNRAKADEKERVAFETVALQTAVFDDLATADQVALLMTGIEDEPSAAVEMFDAMVAAWATGDDDALAAIMTDGMDATPALYDALLTTRNRAWVPQIEGLLGREREDTLVVVGAGHLVGEGSVVEMLRAAGYTVERL